MRGVVVSGVVVAVLAMVVAGCGGGGTETVTQVRTQTSSQPLTKPQYIAQADAICTQYNAKANELEKKINDVGSVTSQAEASQIADVLRQAVDELGPGVQALQSLQPPPADRQATGTYVSTVSGQLSTFRALADAFEALDVREIRSLTGQLRQNEARLQGLAQGYGFKVCGQD